MNTLRRSAFGDAGGREPAPVSCATPVRRRLSLRPAAALVAAVCLMLASPLLTAADDPLSARAIVERAHEAAGGDTWRKARTLQLSGDAWFYRGGTYDSAASADSYRMWRVFPQQSSDAHAANGKVRFDAVNGAATVFQIAFDGEASYDQNGRIDDAAATERWKSNFGFGIIRFALDEGFALTRMADDQVEGHPCHFIRVTDPQSRETLFAIDRNSYAVRMVGFDTPQGFHHRIYDSFYSRPGVSFTQPGHVRLYYDGVKTADIRWRDFRVNEPIADEVFRLAPVAAAAPTTAGTAANRPVDVVDEYLALVTGSFDSSAQAAGDDRYDNAIWHTARIWPDSEGPRWSYTENWLEGMSRPYRQRVNRYTLEVDGSIVVDSFEIPDAEDYVGAWNRPERFADAGPDDLVAIGCPARLARTGERRFEGGTSGQSCRNNYRGAAYLVSRSLADESGVQNWDRGFSADGSQVWGPVAGPYRFQRQGMEACGDPVLMLVYGEIFDRAAFGGYIRALGESGLYPKAQGYYRAISPAVEVFEGDVPSGRGVVLARFPCLNAARSFWNSPEYQELKTLRKDAARFEVSVFRELAVPDYVQW